MKKTMISFSSWTKTLKRITEEVEREKLVLQAVCEDSRLLLKPWPAKKPAKSVEDEKGFTPVEKGSRCPHPTPEISLADDILAKAAKTWTKYSSLIVEDRSTGTKKVLINYPADDVSTADGLTSTGNSLPSCSDGNIPETSTPASASQSSQEACPTSGLTDSRHNSDPAARSRSSSSAVITAQELKNVHKLTTDRSAGDRSEWVTKTSKPILQKDSNRPAAGKSVRFYGKHIPAHQSAPFLTAAPAARVGHKQTKSQQLRQNANQKKLQNRSSHNSAHAARPSPPAVKAFVIPTCESLSESASPSASGLSGDDVVRGAEASGGEKYRPYQQDDGCESRPSQQAGTEEPTEVEPVEENNGKPFLLLSDGGKIVLPRSFHKVISQNCRLKKKLWHKLSNPMAQARKASQGFSDKLQNMIEHSDDPRLFCLLHSVHSLTCMAVNCVNFTEKRVPLPLAENVECQQAVLLKMLTHLMGETFTQIQEEFCAICHGLSKYIDDFDFLHHSGDVPLATSSFSVLPTASVQIPGYTAAMRLSYRSRKELLDYCRAVYNLQTLWVEKQILDKSDELLRVLWSELHGAKTKGELKKCYSLYQFTYALLCSKRTQVPVFIKDCVDNDDDQVTA